MKRNHFLFGVCDGHGLNGHLVAQFIREILPENLEYYFLKNELLHKPNKALIQSSIKDAFCKTGKDLNREMENSGIDIKFSGTTTCLTYIYENKIFCANLGDSRAVIYSRHGEKWSGQPLSQDHKG
jgi:serine/threonine protein phosphatase PrpC